MKKRIIIIVSVILMLGIAFGVGAYALLDTSREPMAKILLSDYKYHGAQTSDGNSLVQVGARLYYSVPSDNNPVKYGLYEITNKEIHRIWWDGIKSSSSTGNCFNNLADYNDSLAKVDPVTGQISIFDFDKKEFVEREGAVSDFVSARSKYQQYQTESDSPVLFTTLFGVDYYVVDRNGSPVLYMSEPDKDTDEVVFDFSQIEGGAVCRDIYSRDATVFVELMTESGVCGFEYRVEKRIWEIIDTESYKGRYASLEYSVKVNNPIGANEADPSVGIYVTEKKSDETKKVYDGYVSEYHILDSKWVYFTLEDYSLWRVSVDGEVTEQVF
ncbi:MAG: hypothetical protein IJD93_02815 [Ruminococcus sp.]|nr:hypothetical protein [Ruminococcus sp.]